VTTADGTILVSGDVALIAFERRLPHPVETVWAALAEPDERAAWLGRGKLEHHVGGQVSLQTGPEGQPQLRRVMSGRVLAWDPPRVLEHEWVQPGLDISVVRYELEPDDGGTILRLTHRRSVTPAATGGRAGWHAYLDRLAAHLGGLPVPPWAERRAAVEAAYGEPPLPQFQQGG
jgi:uncharacterized protein YndB with AHSA1/START domain